MEGMLLECYLKKVYAIGTNSLNTSTVCFRPKTLACVSTPCRIACHTRNVFLLSNRKLYNSQRYLVEICRGTVVAAQRGKKWVQVRKWHFFFLPPSSPAL